MKTFFSKELLKAETDVVTSVLSMSIYLIEDETAIESILTFCTVKAPDLSSTDSWFLRVPSSLSCSKNISVEELA